MSGELVRRLVELTPLSESAPAIPMLFAPEPAPAPAPAPAPGAATHARSQGPANGSGAGETPVHREHRDTSTAHPTDSVAAPSAAPVPHATTDMRRSSPQDPGPAPRNSLPGTVSDTTGQPDRDPSTVVGETTSAGPAAFTSGQWVAPSMPSATGSSSPWSSRTGAAPGSDRTGAAFLGKRIEARAVGRQRASSIEDAPVVYV